MFCNICLGSIESLPILDMGLFYHCYCWEKRHAQRARILRFDAARCLTTGGKSRRVPATVCHFPEKEVTFRQLAKRAGAPGPPSLFELRRGKSTPAPSRHSFALDSVASGGGWRARQDSNLRPPA